MKLGAGHSEQVSCVVGRNTIICTIEVPPKVAFLGCWSQEPKVKVQPWSCAEEDSREEARFRDRERFQAGDSAEWEHLCPLCCPLLRMGNRVKLLELSPQQIGCRIGVPLCMKKGRPGT